MFKKVPLESSSARFTSSEDTFGTVVFRDQSGEPETGTPGSSLGVQERISSSSSENSATNLPEAKAALQGGLRKVNIRERSAVSKITNKSSELKNNSGIDGYISNKVSASEILMCSLMTKW